jgi:hypothetical protein
MGGEMDPAVMDLSPVICKIPNDLQPAWPLATQGVID